MKLRAVLVLVLQLVSVAAISFWCIDTIANLGLLERLFDPHRLVVSRISDYLGLLAADSVLALVVGALVLLIVLGLLST